jgi:hypothetical protein
VHGVERAESLLVPLRKQRLLRPVPHAPANVVVAAQVVERQRGARQRRHALKNPVKATQAVLVGRRRNVSRTVEHVAGKHDRIQSQLAEQLTKRFAHERVAVKLDHAQQRRSGGRKSVRTLVRELRISHNRHARECARRSVARLGPTTLLDRPRTPLQRQPEYDSLTHQQIDEP